MVSSTINPAMAANAYIRTAQVQPVGGATDSVPSSRFVDFLKEKSGDSIETLRTGERMSARAVTGEADITDVVQAVTDADITLQTIVSLRDRMISAYQEIMRMPI